MIDLSAARALAAAPPLDPSPDEARSLLRRELAHPDYHQRNLLEQVLDRLERVVTGSIDSASQASSLSTFVAIVAVLLLGLALAWLLSRARSNPRSARSRNALLDDPTLSADQLRARATQALRDGRNEDAVVDGFRALAMRQAERGRVEVLPGATAREVAHDLGAAHPGHRDRVEGSAAVFDGVRYGHHRATPAQATMVLELGDDLRGRS